MTSTPLPGETGPLPMRYGGAPVNDTEALGVYRRTQVALGRPAPDELPTHDARIIPTAHRLPPRLMARVRARAEMEGATVTRVIEEALEAYAASTPGSRATYQAPKRR